MSHFIFTLSLILNLYLSYRLWRGAGTNLRNAIANLELARTNYQTFCMLQQIIETQELSKERINQFVIEARQNLVASRQNLNTALGPDGNHDDETQKN